MWISRIDDNKDGIMNDITCDMKGQTKRDKSLMICDMRTDEKEKSIFLKELIPHQMYIMYKFDYH